MPHYKDGSEAKVGDFVKGKPDWTPTPVVGVVTSIQPGATTCNMSLDRVDVLYALDADGKPTNPRAIVSAAGCFTIGEFEKIA